MMIQLKCLVTVCAACLAVVCSQQEGVESLLSRSTQEVPKSSQSESIDQEKEDRIKAEVAEIMAIRKQLGGGVSEQLKGFSIEMPGGAKDTSGGSEAGQAARFEETFAKKLAAQSRNAVAIPAPTGKRWKQVHQETDDSESAIPTQEGRETIRKAARMLEEAAALLEEAEQFNQADSIRDTAGELWQTARKR